MKTTEMNSPIHRTKSNSIASNGKGSRDTHLGNYHVDQFYSDDQYLSSPYQSGKFMQQFENCDMKTIWKPIDKLTTSAAVLVVCLNIGTDPPDVIKPSVCARKECWIDPFSAPKTKALQMIGSALQHQYQKLQPNAKLKPCLDPSSEELQKVCQNIRKMAGSDRVLFHYNGHGVPRPTADGDIWVYGHMYTHYMPISIVEIKKWLGNPAIYVLDYSGAGGLLPFFEIKSDESHGTEAVEGRHEETYSKYTAPIIDVFQDNIVLAACSAKEVLPVNPHYPADLFTCCLTTPIVTAVRWFILQNPYTMAGVNPDVCELIPGKENDRNTILGQICWIYLAVTETIAWSSLSPEDFQRYLRQELLTSALMRNFILARRVLESANCTPQSLPPLPETSSHPLWLTWDLFLESLVTNMIVTLNAASVTPSSSTTFSTSNQQLHQQPPHAATLFFSEQLNAFEVWLDFQESKKEDCPVHLPILLQAILSKTNRTRGLLLLRRYIGTGAMAVKYTLAVGLSRYLLKLLKCPDKGVQHIVVQIWAYILGYHPESRTEVLSEKMVDFFIKYFVSPNLTPSQRCLAACAIAQICDGFRAGQELCLQYGLFKSCLHVIDSKTAIAQSFPLLKQWTVLCFAKVCEDNVWAKYICLTESKHTRLYSLLVDPDPAVRAATVYTLGESLGASDVTKQDQGYDITGRAIPGTPSGACSGGSGGGSYEASGPSLAVINEIRMVELQLAIQILESCTDGSALVRHEATIALSRFVFLQFHKSCLKAVISSLGRERFGSDDYRELSRNPTFPNSLLDPQNSRRLVASVEAFIERLLKPTIAVSSDAISGNFISPTLPVDGRTCFGSGSFDLFDTSAGGSNKFTSTNKSPSLSMALSYVRIWMALKEICSRDSHPQIRQSVATIIKALEAETRSDDAFGELVLDDYTSLSNDADGDMEAEGVSHRSLSSLDDPSFEKLSPLATAIAATAAMKPNIRTIESLRSLSINTATSESLFPTVRMHRTFSRDSNNSNNYIHNCASSEYILSKKGEDGSGPFLSLSATAVEDAQLSQKFPSLNQLDPLIIPAVPSPFAPPPMRSVPSVSDLTTPKSPAPPRIQSFFMVSGKWFSGGVVANTANKDKEEYSTTNKNFRQYVGFHLDTHQDAFLKSGLYELNKRILLGGLDTSDQTKPFQRRDSEGKLDAFVVDPLSQEARAVELREGRRQWTHGLVSDFQHRYGIVGGRDRLEALSYKEPNAKRFQQHAVLKADPVNTIRSLSFHAFEDVLAVASGSKVELWSCFSNRKRTSLTDSATSGRGIGSPVTAISWLNESFPDPLIAVATEDGGVKIWSQLFKDDQGTALRQPRLCSAFSALPDIDNSITGSGVVLAWHQSSGTLLAGGNSQSIRLWDLSREQCVRAFDTGMDTCLTALATEAVTETSSPSTSDYRGEICSHTGMSSSSFPTTWVFAGFADGSVGVYDERVSSANGRVMRMEDSDRAWLVNAHLLRAQAYGEVVTGSLKGVVRYWDVRTLKSYKTIEVQKSAMTAMAVHNFAPIMCCGSQKQFVKVLTLDGELIETIRYFDGFIPQPIGVVTSIVFHPLLERFAVGNAEGLISVYS